MLDVSTYVHEAKEVASAIAFLNDIKLFCAERLRVRVSGIMLALRCVFFSLLCLASECSCRLPGNTYSVLQTLFPYRKVNSKVAGTSCGVGYSDIDEDIAVWESEG